MTRPNIIRADTIDLQDQHSPKASTHSKRPSQEGLAPHQASQVHHVIEDRQSEEQVLADAWNITDDLTTNPNAIHQAQLNQNARNVNGGEHQGQEVEETDESEQDLDDDMMDRISSSPSIDEEDIDFEFVYALHTFVATVEGQANATKGDTMVLLDDSNSYWWLVRVVKDNSIGYLPAEHIETPTERLARLNKHRNIDLAATMLSDNAERSRNPLKKAIRRRNAKTVQFAAPTYVEASDYDYDTEEDEKEQDEITSEAHNSTEEAEAHAREHDQNQGNVDNEDESETAATVASLTSSETPEQKEKQSKRASFDREQAATASALINDSQSSPRLVDKTEAAPLKSRKGTPRNTDSFLRDDSIETRKITLTPGLLREDNSSTKSNSSEVIRGNSLDVSVKPEPALDTASVKKDGKKEKKEPKKAGMLSGLFKSKKKDKKAKDDTSDQSEGAKSSAELTRPGSAGALSTNGMDSSASSPVIGRHPLFGEPRFPPAGTTWAQQREDMLMGAAVAANRSQPTAGPTFYAELEGSSTAHDNHQLETAHETQDDISDATRAASHAELSGSAVESQHVEVPSEAKHDIIPGGINSVSSQPIRGGKVQSEDDDGDTTPTEVAVPATAPKPAVADRTKAVVDEDAHRKPSMESTDTSTSSSLPTSSHIPSSASSQQSWSDSSLRTWLDDGREVKDMLVMIHDSSGVTPVGADHPLMEGLFVGPRKGVEGMMGELDGLLSSYLHRKGITLT